MEGLKYLKNRYDLHNSPEVKSAVKRQEIISEEKVPQDPLVQIQTYFDRFKEISDRTNPKEKERGLRALKEVLHRSNVVNPENIPESYFKRQEQEIVRNEGRPYTEEDKQKSIEGIQTDQIDSLNRWVDYLSGPDAPYPDWAKYWFTKSILAMGPYDNQKHEYSKRSKNTTKGFPELNPESLSTVYDLMNSKLEGEVVENPVELIPNPHNPDEQKRFTDEQFEKLLTTENFAKYYAFASEFAGVDNSEHFPNIEGEWKMYPKGSVPDELVDSLQGQGTRWCTAGKGTATIQLKQGDFYVYYSKNTLGDNTIPRLAIRMHGEYVGEVRGVDLDSVQDLDRYIAPVVVEKMQEFGGDGEKYTKMANGMQHLTQIEDKQEAEEDFDVQDLRFIYELDGPIKTFTHNKDVNPRVTNLRISRGLRPFKEDMLKIYGTSDDIEIATNILAEDTTDTFFNNLEQFKELSPAIVDFLVEKDSVKLVVYGTDSFSEEAKLALIDVIANSPESIQIICSNLNSTSSLSPELAKAVIKAGYGEKLINHLEKIPTEAQNQIIRDLALTHQLDSGSSGRFGYDIPVKIELETAITLFENGYYYYLTRNLDCLADSEEKLSSEIALRLIENNFGKEVSQNIKSFQKEDFMLVAERLIDSGLLKELLSNSPYKYLDSSLAIKIIEKQDVVTFVDNIDKFDGLFDLQVGEAVLDSDILTSNKRSYVIENINLFQDLNPNKVLELMMAREVKAFNLGLENFKDNSLSTDMAKKLVSQNKDYCFNAVNNLDKFEIEDCEEFLDILLSSEHGRKIFINFAHKFKKYFDPETLVKKVWKAGGALQVYGIEGVDHDVILDEIISSDESEQIIENLESEILTELSGFNIDDLTVDQIKNGKDIISKIIEHTNSILVKLTKSGLVDGEIVNRFKTLISKLENINSQLVVNESEVVET